MHRWMAHGGRGTTLDLDLLGRCNHSQNPGPDQPMCLTLVSVCMAMVVWSQTSRISLTEKRPCCASTSAGSTFAGLNLMPGRGTPDGIPGVVRELGSGQRTGAIAEVLCGARWATRIPLEYATNLGENGWSDEAEWVERLDLITVVKGYKMGARCPSSGTKARQSHTGD